MTKEELMKYPLFQDFSDTEADLLIQTAIQVKFEKDQMLFESDKSGDEMYILQSGLVKVFRTVKSKDVTLTFLTPGDFCGEMSLVDDGARSASAKAVEPTQAISLTRQQFESLRDQAPSLYLKLLDIIIKLLCLRLRQANQTMEVIRFWIG